MPTAVQDHWGVHVPAPEAILYLTTACKRRLNVANLYDYLTGA